jgi:hypothetical protein
MNQRVGGDFFSSRIQADIPKKTLQTITFLARACPICGKATRTLIRPAQVELDSEIGVECGCHGDAKYPSAHISFQGSFVRDGHIIVETLRGSDGSPGRDGKDAEPPTRAELTSALQGLLEQTKGLRRLFLKIFFDNL